MVVHPLYGLAMPELGWVPSPGYVLRRHRVLAWLDRLPAGRRALEIGCGAGALLHDLGERGYRCDALESSPRALELLAAAFGDRDDVHAHATPGDDWAGRFDLLLAFEVLEHIEDDAGALRAWVDWLAPGGHVLLSVPAHERRWNPTDEWAGHFRRYEADGLRARLEEAGLEVVALECYGFPLANLLEAVRARTYQRGATTERAGATAASGVERTVETKLWPAQTSPVGQAAMIALCRAQDAFLDRELGNGFFAVARRRQA
ncbi:MAG: class I SAM-dependent methyltransferase [Sandaracinaceae bacterium]|nr:class I SAM-dependent methyltransferase [Sandaracinaceae bacterium]